MGLEESHPQAPGSVKNIGRKWKSELPMAEHLLYKNFIAQVFEESGIMAVILKCCLKNATPIYCSKPVFLPCAIALLWSKPLALSFKWTLCCQICSLVQKALSRLLLLSFLVSLQTVRLWSLGWCSWSLGCLPRPCPFIFLRVPWHLLGVSTQDCTWESPEECV